MKKLLLILLCLPFIGFGQGWEKFFGEYAYGASVQQTTDGGYIVCGADYLPEQLIYIIKTNSQGDSLWTKRLGGNDSGEEGNIGKSIQQTNDGGYIICTKYDTICGGMIMKLDTAGNTDWSYYANNMNTDTAVGYNCVKQTNDGGYIFCGGYSEYDSSSLAPISVAGYSLLKLDENGNQQWEQFFTGQGFQDVYSINVQQTTDEGYIMCGFVDGQAYLLKTDSLGNQMWEKKFGGVGEDRFDAVEQTTDGGYIACGYKHNGYNGSNAIKTVYLVKTDSNGNELWNKNIGGVEGRGWSIEETSNGEFIICGHKGYYNDFGELYLIKTDSQGDSLWTKNLGIGKASSVKQTTDGGYILTGVKSVINSNNTGVFALCLIKTDGNGNVTSTINIPTINTSKGKLIRIVDMLGRETKPQTNTPFIEIYDDGTVEKRIVIE